MGLTGTADLVLPERKLATVLAADCVGYSRLMAADEEATAVRLAEYRAIIDEIIALHGGRIFNTAGDSVIAEFNSPVESVRAALEIQEALKTRNLDFPSGRQLRFRIGINLGDVIIRGDDLLGDAVNVAARLESIAEPGGILLSSSVYDQISGKLNVGFQNIGQPALKNISRPISVYRVSGERQSKEDTKLRWPKGPVLAGAVCALLLLVGVSGWWFEMHGRPSSASSGHWLNGDWVGLVTIQPANPQTFCDPPDGRCRSLIVSDVTGDGQFEGAFGFFGNQGVAQIIVSGNEVDVTTTRSHVILTKSEDGRMKGKIENLETNKSYAMIMRRK